MDIIKFEKTEKSNKIMSEIYITNISSGRLVSFSGGKESLLTRHVVHL